MFLDLCFPVRGEELPTDHNYLLYAAIAHAVRAVHASDTLIRFAAIPGLRGPKGRLKLFAASRLRMRLSAEHITEAMPLAGRSLKVGEHSITLGVPTVVPLTPAPT